LRKKLREYHFELVDPELVMFFKLFANYELRYETLGAIAKLQCKRGCRDNGGPPRSKIRNCCRDHDFGECWQCTEFETCENLNFLTPTHGNAQRKNLRTINKRGVDAFLKGKMILENFDELGNLSGSGSHDGVLYVRSVHTNELERSFSTFIAYT